MAHQLVSEISVKADVNIVVANCIQLLLYSTVNTC